MAGYNLSLHSRQNNKMVAASVFLIGFIAGCLTGVALRQRHRFRETSTVAD